MAVNLLTNLELATDTTGWSTYGTPGSAGLDGQYSRIAALPSAPLEGVTTGLWYNPSAWEPGVYTIAGHIAVAIPTPRPSSMVASVYALAESAITLENIGIRYWTAEYAATAAGSEGFAAFDSAQGLSTTEWSRHYKALAVPDDAAYVSFAIRSQRMSPAGCYYTACKLEEGTEPTPYGQPLWTASLLINDDDASTDDNDVVLTISALGSDGQPPDQMRFAEAPVGTDPGDVVWGAWEPYATTRNWQLAAQTDEAAHDIGVGVEFQRT
jgi:hypothetical protein